MNIGLDMMGGDYSPEEAVKGVASFLTGNDRQLKLYLFGNEGVLRPLLDNHAVLPDLYQIVDARQVIEMHEQPTRALKEKQQSSIALGFKYLASGITDAFISAGNSGAIMIGSLFTLKAIPGVLRPTISTIVPQENGKSAVLVDVGLNSDCKPEHLNQFAVLGSLYAQHILGIQNPKCGLVNIGEEEGKGNLLAQATYPLLKDNPQINFIGNIEGRDLLIQKADVMICDGFTGNIVLKLVESLYDITHRNEISHEFFDRFDFENYGGTPVLGVNRPVIVGHGISHEKAFLNMIRLAVKMIDTDLLGKMRSAFPGD